MRKFSAIALVFSVLLLSACSPNEADYKSKVPVTEKVVNGSSQQPIPQAVPPSAPQPVPVQVPKPVPPSVPQPIAQPVPQPAPQPVAQPVTPPALPPEINLNVPFFSQAPDGDWGMPWQEACEEASSTLAVYYATQKPLTKEQFKKDIVGLVDWENKNFGFYKDTTVDQTAQMIRGYFGFTDFKIVDNPTVDQLERLLADGSAIVAPFSGKDLKNPFYNDGGPIYHMMVLRGYDAKNFIVNDVGTKRGENFIYPIDRIMETMHDWNATDMHLGAKKVMVFSRISK